MKLLDENESQLNSSLVLDPIIKNSLRYYLACCNKRRSIIRYLCPNLLAFYVKTLRISDSLRQHVKVKLTQPSTSFASNKCQTCLPQANQIKAVLLARNAASCTSESD